MSREKDFVLVGKTFQTLEFRADHHMPFAVAADVQGDHPDGVAGNKVFVLFLVVKGKSIDPVEVFQEVDALFPVERQDHLAVRTGLELVFPLQLLAQFAVIVDLSVHAQHLCPVGADQGLSAGSRVHDRKAFVSQHGRAAAVDTAPVRSAMADGFTHLQGLAAHGFRLPCLDIENSCDSAHGVKEYFRNLALRKYFYRSCCFFR